MNLRAGKAAGEQRPGTPSETHNGTLSPAARTWAAISDHLCEAARLFLALPAAERDAGFDSDLTLAVEYADQQERRHDPLGRLVQG